MKRRGRQGFDEEFRREAVRLAESGTMPIAEVARQLGIHHETLRNWRRKESSCIPEQQRWAYLPFVKKPDQRRA